MSDWLIQAVGFVGMVLCIGSFQCKNTRHLLFFQMTGNFIYVIQFIILGAYSGCALCGGEGDRAAFPYSPYFRYSLPRYPGEPDEEIEREMAKRWRRRVLRLTPPEI